MKDLLQSVFSKKLTLFVFGFVFLLVLITGVIFIESSQKSQNPIITSNSPTPTPTFNTNEVAPSPPVDYDSQATTRMLNILKSRPQLSTTDKTTRDSLINSLGNKSGILNQTDDYSLEYVKVPDAFMAEIKTTDLEKAKGEAVDWLKSKGLSQDGICHLPLVFYINFQTAQSLRGSNTSFNPLPAGC